MPGPGAGRHPLRGATGTGRLVEIVGSPLDVGRLAALFPVEVQGCPPHHAGLPVIAEGDMRIAEPIEGIGGRSPGRADVADW